MEVWTEDKSKRVPQFSRLSENFLQKETIVRGLSEKSPYYRMGKIETIMGEHSITSFELDYDVGKWKLKTICPHCGIKLGDSK